MFDEQLSLFSQQTEGSQEFFTRKRSWSASKHRIMLRYIQSQCYNLGGDKSFQSKHINYVDGFAGEGKYDEGFGIEDFVEQSNFWKRYDIDLLDTDGSPLIALKCAKVFSLENRVNLRCFFVEADKASHQNLIKNCQVIGQDLDCKIYDCKEFSRTLPEIIQDLQEYPTLFFADTFGVKGFGFEQIRLIGDYLSKYRGELFFLFHNRQVARHAGQLTTRSTNAKMRKTCETYTENLTELLGPDSDKDWKPKWLELRDRPQQFEKWALEYFKKKIQSKTKFRGVASYEIKEKYNDARPQYSLIVCSNHPQKAFGEFLNEFFAEEEKLLFYEDDKSGVHHQFLTKKWQQQESERKSEIKPIIVDLLKKQREWLSIKDVITLVILEVGKLGHLKRPQYRQIMLELFSEGVIEAKSLGIKKVPTLDSLVRVVQ